MGAPATARRITEQELPAVLERLGEDPRRDLWLLDLARRLGAPPPPGEMATELIGAYRGDELVGVASLRPTIAFDTRMDAEALDALLPRVLELEVGLVKSDPERVERLWRQVKRRRRHRVWLDRLETCYALEADDARLVGGDAERVARPAGDADLDALVYAARESLREEDRPDPFGGDSRGFRRWVGGRLGRARIVESRGEVRFVGYADVRLPEGWLLQGIYTWPEARRRGHAAVGTSALCREAFAAAAEHVQLAVVDGNGGARQLYEGLGFKPFGRLRTILFT